MGALVRPLLPDHPPLLSRQPHGERTIYVSPELPLGMERSGDCWSLSHFTLTKQLYKGKASTLYQATDKPSGLVVALKTYSKRRLSDLNWYQVEREIRLHARLRHPSILQLHAAFEDDTHVFMVCEFASGGDLYEDLKRAGGQMKERVVAGEVLPPFMDAVAHMHALSILHRDIKPENILLGAGRAIKVADFGLSINAGEERPVTRAGTLDYMSPEVLLCPEKSRPEENKERSELGYSQSVDVWAVGVLAYELLVGRPPFERETREETYACIRRQEAWVPPGVSQAARDFIQAALRKNPRKRPSMAELLRHPWIAMHSCNTSTASPPRTSEFSPPRQQPGSAARPRASLHGAKSVRGFSALLSGSSNAHLLAASLQPALSIAATLAPTASNAAAALEPVAAVRPTTARSHTAHTLPDRPVTPGLEGAGPLPAAAELTAALPPPAFNSASTGEAADQGQASSAPGENDSALEVRNQPAFVATRAAGAGLNSLATSLRLPTSAAGTVQDDSFVSASSRGSGVGSTSPAHSFTQATTKLSTSPSQQATSPPGAAEQQADFLGACESLAASPLSQRAAPAPPSPAPPMSHGQPGNLAGGAVAHTADLRGFNAGLPPLLHQQQHAQERGLPGGQATPSRLPSLCKAASHTAAGATHPAAAAVAPRTEAVICSAAGESQGEQHPGQPVAAGALVRSTDPARAAKACAGELHAGLQATSWASPAKAPPPRLPLPQQQQQQRSTAGRERQPVSSYGAGIARSAFSLLNKLLGRKQTPPTKQPDGHGAGVGPQRMKSIDFQPAGVAAKPDADSTSAAIHLTANAGSSSTGPGSTRHASPGAQPQPEGRSTPHAVPAAAPPNDSSNSVSIGLPGSIALLRPVRLPVPGRAVPAAQSPASEVEAYVAAPGLAAVDSLSAGSEPAVSVEPSSASKAARLAAPQHARADDAPEQGSGGLIPAFHPQPAAPSHPTAANRLPSLAAPPSTSHAHPASLKSSLTASARNAAAVPPSTRGSLGRAAAPPLKPRAGKGASMPGGPEVQPGAEGESCGGDAAGGTQRSAASWSHSVAGRKGVPTQQRQQSLASTARLSMYRQLAGASGRTTHVRGAQKQ